MVFKSGLLTILGLWGSTLHKFASAIECTRGKLFVVDEENPRVAIFDADFPNEYKDPVFVNTHHNTLSFRFSSATSTNLVVALVNLGVNAFSVDDPAKVGGVSFIDTGVRPTFHQVSVHKETPKLLDFHLDCIFPVHFFSNDLKIGQFCDGEISLGINSTVWLVDETKLLANSDSGEDTGPLLYTNTLPGSHHGLIAPMGGDDVLVSVITPDRLAGNPDPLASQPDGFEVINYKTEEVVHGLNENGDPHRSCTAMHGDTHSGDTAAFACDQDHGGILIFQYGGIPRYQSRAINYPPGFDNARSSFVKSHLKNTYFVAPFSGGEEYNLLAFDPVREQANMTLAHVQPLSVPYCGGYDFEQSSGQLFFLLLQTGILQVYAMNPWTLVSEVQVIPDMDDCMGTTMVAGHGYAYVLRDQTIYEVDVRDPASIAVTPFDTGIKTHTSVPIPIGITAGVPNGYECGGVEVPDTPPKNREGSVVFVELHFDNEDMIAPGSATQATFVREFRRDLGRALSVGVDRIYVMDFHYEDDGAIVELFFVDHGPVDVNKDSAESLKSKFAGLVENGSLPGTLSLLRGSVMDNPSVAADQPLLSNDDDEWPTGAKVAVGIVGGLCLVALVAAAVFAKKHKEALAKAEAVKAAERTVSDDSVKGDEGPLAKNNDNEQDVVA